MVFWGAGLRTKLYSVTVGQTQTVDRLGRPASFYPFATDLFGIVAPGEHVGGCSLDGASVLFDIGDPGCRAVGTPAFDVGWEGLPADAPIRLMISSSDLETGTRRADLQETPKFRSGSA